MKLIKIRTEIHGRLLFLAFIKPIINGIGFDFKEVAKLQFPKQADYSTLPEI